jgi:hypothetical protein
VEEVDDEKVRVFVGANVAVREPDRTFEGLLVEVLLTLGDHVAPSDVVQLAGRQVENLDLLALPEVEKYLTCVAKDGFENIVFFSEGL